MATQTISLGERIGRLCPAGSVIALYGGLAAGKTTLAKGIALGLDIEDELTSPTFTLLNEYSGRLALYHFDAYRLSGPSDFEDLGSDEIFRAGGVCLIEWSERIEGALPPFHSKIRIVPQEDQGRQIEIIGPLEDALP